MCVITAGVRESHIFTCSDSRRILPPKRTRFHLLPDFTLGSSYSSPSEISSASERPIGSTKPYANGHVGWAKSSQRRWEQNLHLFPTLDGTRTDRKKKRLERRTGSNYSLCIFNLNFIVRIINSLKRWKISKTVKGY